MAYNAFDHLESFPPRHDFVASDSLEMCNKFNKRPHAEVDDNSQTNRPSFKGSLEDLVMITNFKRFKRKGSSSRYKGVFYVKKEKKYRAQICLKGKKKYVGTFKNDKEAAIARDQKIREMFGEVEELLNFPLCKSEENAALSEQISPEGEKSGFGLGINDIGQSGNAMLSNLVHAEDETVAKNVRDMRSRLSTLTRYGSSGCSLSFPNFGFSNLNEATENPSGLLDMNMNQTFNGINYGNFDTQGAQNNQGNGTILNARYNGYGMNSLMGFNFQDLSAPRGTLLAKRFSSNDSYGFGSNADQLSSPYNLNMLQSSPNTKYSQFGMGVPGASMTAAELEKQTRLTGQHNGGSQV